MNQLTGYIAPAAGGATWLFGWARDAKWAIATGAGLLCSVLALRVAFFLIGRTASLDAVLCVRCRERVNEWYDRIGIPRERE